MTNTIENYVNKILNSEPTIDPLARAAMLYKTAVAIWDSTTKISFIELNKLTNIVAKNLQTFIPVNSISIQKPIIIKATPTIEYLVTIFAFIRLGLVYMPISPKMTQAEREQIFKSTNGFFFDTTNTHEVLEHISISSNSTQNNQIPEYLVDFEKPINIMLSSGSLGVPKKIVHNLRTHIISATGAQAGLKLYPSDRYLLSLPLNHVGGQAIIFRTLLTGSSIVLPQVQPKYSLNKLVKEQKISILSLVPTQLMRMLNDNDIQISSTSLKAIILGGAPITSEIIDQTNKKAPTLKMYATYGMTETAAQVCTSEISSTTDYISSHVLPYHQVKIVNQEVLIKGPTIAIGLLEKGHIIPLTDADGFLHTGDLGKLTNNKLSIIGRLGNMFISGGENISPEYVEKCILEHTATKACVVVPVPHKEWGQASCAIVDTSLSITELRKKLKTYLNSIYLPKYFLPWPNHIKTELKIKRIEFIAYAQKMLNIH